MLFAGKKYAVAYVWNDDTCVLFAGKKVRCSVRLE